MSVACWVLLIDYLLLITAEQNLYLYQYLYQYQLKTNRGLYNRT